LWVYTRWVELISERRTGAKLEKKLDRVCFCTCNPFIVSIEKKISFTVVTIDS